MALIDPAPRSATAVAGPDCTVAAVDEATFHQLVKRVPGIALEMMRIMVRRLRHTAAKHGAAGRRRPNAARSPDPLVARGCGPARGLFHGHVLVTRNVKDDAWTGVRCLNPVESASR